MKICQDRRLETIIDLVEYWLHKVVLYDFIWPVALVAIRG